MFHNGINNTPVRKRKFAWTIEKGTVEELSSDMSAFHDVFLNTWHYYSTVAGQEAQLRVVEYFRGVIRTHYSYQIAVQVHSECRAPLFRVKFGKLQWIGVVFKGRSYERVFVRDYGKTFVAILCILAI